MRNFDEETPTKYHINGFLTKLLIKNFQKRLADILIKLKWQSLHEAGCGDGYVLSIIKEMGNGGKLITGSDISKKFLSEAKKLNPEVIFFEASIYNLPFRDNQFDIVVACEVLEHLKNPEDALTELKRITNKYVVLSVPLEPLWRIINFLRGWYWSTWGNYPGHLQNWTPHDFRKLVSQELKIKKFKIVFPWMIILAEK